MNTTESPGNEQFVTVSPNGAPLLCTEAKPATTSESAPVAPFKRRRWGSIQRLSPRTRTWINKAIRDGLTNKQIFAGLAQRRCTNISPKQLRVWSKTGYADWLRDQQAFERLVLTTDRVHTQKAPAAKTQDFRDLSQLDIAVLLHNAAREFNLEKIRQQLDSKPDTFFRLVHANALHERNAILRDRNEIEVKKVAVKEEKQKRARTPKKGGVTAEKLEAIKARLNIM